jgi:predicted HicB family RNase H-like nuclease
LKYFACVYDGIKKGINMPNNKNIISNQPVSTTNGKEYNGSISLRIPKPLHQSLIEEAEDESVSLNQLLLTKIAVSLYDKTKSEE